MKFVIFCKIEEGNVSDCFPEKSSSWCIRLFEMSESHLARCEQLMGQYSELPMGFADTSSVALAECLGHGRIVSTDQGDFGIYRWKNRWSFENLLQ